MLGYVQRAQLTNVFVVTQQLSSQSFFGQDDWRASDKLTVNLGLRYDYMAPAARKTTGWPTSTRRRRPGAWSSRKTDRLRDRALVNPDRTTSRRGLAPSTS